MRVSLTTQLGHKTLLALTLALFAQVVLALAPSEAQQETLVDMIETLEKRHYAKYQYDDALSRKHLDEYVRSLDPQRMFFSSEDLATFNQWQDKLDDLGREGDLTPAFSIFNRYQELLEARYQKVIETLPAEVEKFDFTKQEYLVIDGEDRPWAANKAELDDRWRKRLKNQVLSLRLADKAEDEIAPTLVKRYSNQLKRVSQYNAQDVFQVYANTLAEVYDPHTGYFSPRNAENFDINMSLSFDGIGAVLQIDDEYTKVSRIVPAGPADKQGELEPSNLIIGVGQGEEGPIEDVIGWRLDEVVDLIRGPRGTTVRLEVIPDKGKTEGRKIIAIERNQVKLEEQAAQGKLIEVEGDDGKPVKLGVIDIPAFYIDFAALRARDPNYKSTTRDVAKIIEDLESQGAEGLIIDLRNNGGGSLQEANDLTGLFIEYGPTVQIRSAQRRVWRDGKRARSDFYEGPVAVLINRLSASASEIFAGAIQDYGRGIILGERSFGKGTVQTLVDLPEGQLKVTESKFYRISGDSTQHRGVTPDIAFPSLFDESEIGESSLDYALDWDQISAVRHTDYHSLVSVLPALKQKFEKRTATDPDFQFILDQVKMAEEARSIEQLPLSETERREMRATQEAKALAIENRKRVAKGLEPLDELATEDDEEDAVAEETADQTVDTSDEEEDDDVLLIEAGRVLADAMSLTSTMIAQASQEETATH